MLVYYANFFVFNTCNYPDEVNWVDLNKPTADTTPLTISSLFPSQDRRSEQGDLEGWLNDASYG